MCYQQSLRSACAYAQSDQRLSWSLEYSLIIKLLTEHHLEFLSLKVSCRGSSVSTLVKMSHCWESHALAHIVAGVFSRAGWLGITWSQSPKTCFLETGSRIKPFSHVMRMCQLKLIRKSFFVQNFKVSGHSPTPHLHTFDTNLG